MKAVGLGLAIFVSADNHIFKHVTRHAFAKGRKRIARVWAMTRTVMAMSREALRRANPSLSEREMALLIIRTNYGADLAARVDEQMRKQGR